jgi:hypothetical protein
MRRILIVSLFLGLAGCDGGGGPVMRSPEPSGGGEDSTAGGEDVAGGEDGRRLEDLAGLEDVPAPSDASGADLSPPPDVPAEDVPACLAGLSCDDGDLCTEDFCDPEHGCRNVAKPAGDCDDGNPCTDDSCHPAFGCVNLFNELPCDDGDGCTWGDHCRGGICRGTLNETNACSYAQVPTLGSCKKGAVTGASKSEALATVNQVRALSGLPPVTYDLGGDAEVQAAALIMAANADLSHFPPQSWSCWTQAGYDGAGSSNLHMSWYSAPLDPKPPSEAVVGFLIDWDVPSLGHRRWLLDPFLPSVSWGAAGGFSPAGGDWPYVWAGILQVMKDGAPSLAGLDLDFVAYPVGDYPAEWFETGWYLSFSALVDKGSSWGNSDVSFSAAQITVSGPGGPLGVYDVSHSAEYFGLPNHLQWRVSGLQAGVTYTVTIDGVKDGGQTRGYEYSFRLY